MAEFGGNSQDSDNNLEPFNNHCEHVAAKLDDAGSSNHCEDKALADEQRSVEAMKCVEEIDNANDVAMDSSNEIADKSIGYDSVIDNTENLTLGTLKKDDSGICMEKSPQKEGAVSDESEATHTDTDANSSRTDTDSGKMKTDRSLESVSEENRTHTSLGSETDAGLVQDFLDTEENMSSNRYDLDLANHSSSDSEKPDSDTDVRRTRKRRQSRSRSRSNSDSRSRSRSRSSSSEREADDEDVKSKSSDSPDEMEIDLEPPRHKWTALYEMRNREYGSSSTLVGHTLFRQRVTSALCMVQRMELQYKMDYHEGCVNALNFNRKGTLLASGSDDLNIVLWNWANNKPALVYDSGHRSNVFQSKFLPYSGDLHVVSCARDGQVRLAELSTTGICKDTKKLAQHRGAAHKLALEMDSAHLFLSCGEDAVTHEIDLRQEKANKISTTKEGDRKVALYSIHSNPSNSFEFCVGGRDHFIRIYDKRKIAEDENDGVLKKFCPPHLLNSDIKANVTCAVYNYNGTEVMGTYNDEDIYLFDNQHSDGADYTHRYTGHRNNATVKGVNFYGAKSEYIISGSDCGHVFLWDKDSEKIVQFFEADDGGVINVLEPHPNGPIIATSGLDHDIKIWAPTLKEVTDLKGLKEVMKKNRKERRDERVNEPDMIDGQMLWFLMHHLRRSARRRARRDGQEVSTSSEESERDEESEDSDAPEPMQCVHS